MNTDERTPKRVRITEVRGVKRQSGDVEELDAGAGDAADAMSEQVHMEERPMNRLVSSKTEVFEKSENHFSFKEPKILTMMRSWSCEQYRTS